MTQHPGGDTALLLGRSLRHILRSPDTIITTTIMPIAFLLLFVYVLGGAIETGSDSYVSYLLPGILLITVASGVAYTAFRLFLDLQSGIFERFHSMPITRSSVLWAHVLTSLVANLVSLVVVVLVALAMGFRSGAGPLAWLAVAGILLPLHPGADLGRRDPGPVRAVGRRRERVLLPADPAAVRQLGLRAHGHDARPVRAFAEHQPVTAIVDALRALLTEQPVGSEIWVALAWCVGILLVAFALAMAAYRRRFA